MVTLINITIISDVVLIYTFNFAAYIKLIDLKKTMATKRTPSDDFVISPIPPKEARTEGQTHPAVFVITSSSSDSQSHIQLSTESKTPSALYVSPVQTGPTLIPGSLQVSLAINSTMVPAILPSPYTVSTPVASLVVSAGDAVEFAFSCSSPSQFLHPPLSYAPASSSAPFATPLEVSTLNRQPICSVESRPTTLSKTQSTTKNIRSKILKNRKAKIAAMKARFDFLVKEKFFLEGGGNMMDFLSWRKKPNILRDQFLKQSDLDFGGNQKQHKTSTNSETSKATSVEFNPLSATTIQIPLSTVSPSLHVTPPKGSTPVSPAKSVSFPSSSPRPATRAHISFSSVYENSHEDIVMRARHEAEVMKAISELRKEGLWSASRLPKVQEAVRIKSHWDYLLEEMQWLAADFANERRWKLNAAKKVSIIVTIVP